MGKIKCGQQMGGDTAIADKCNKCPECPSFPSSCAEVSSLDNQPKLSGKFSIGQSWADWADFFNPQAAGNLWSTDYCSGTEPTPALTAVPTTAPTPAPPTPECTDELPPWKPDFVKGCKHWSWPVVNCNACNKNAAWTNGKYCQQSCFDNGCGYDGDDCSSNIAPTPTPPPAPTTATVQALWPQSGASNSKCAGANHEHAVASQNACQAEAVAAGHEYYQFSDHGYYYMCATAATCSSHITGTGTPWTWRIYAQATTAVPTPTPPSANCLSWCAVNTNPWSKKCAWNKNCNECDDCLAPAPPTPAPPTPAPPTVANPNCGAWCAANTNPWTQKCKWPNCACSECP